MARAEAVLERLEYELPRMEPRPKLLILNFPANPTTQCVELPFFERIVALCRELGIYIVHDLAYADIVFDGYRAPSVLEVPGAKDIAVEFFTLSKSYNMPGWRVGFMVGNHEAGRGAGADQELLRLWDVYADPGGCDCCARRAAGLCRGDSSTTTSAGAMCWCRG